MYGIRSISLDFRITCGGYGHAVPHCARAVVALSNQDRVKAGPGTAGIRWTGTIGAHPWSLTFPWVATHPHFTLLGDKAAPLQSAPVIKLADTASEDEFLQLAALLNSSAACFWLKKYSHAKGSPRADQLRAEESWEFHYEFTSTCLMALPIPSRLPGTYGHMLDELAQQLGDIEPAALCARQVPTRDRLDLAKAEHDRILRRMIALQEELDWHVYMLYGMLDSGEAAALTAEPYTVPEVQLGQRAFEIVLARRVKASETKTEWFTRHGATPTSEIPRDWPEEYRDVVARRIEVIERSRNIDQIERPDYKRRWQSEPWEQEKKNGTLCGRGCWRDAKTAIFGTRTMVRKSSAPTDCEHASRPTTCPQ